MTRAGTQATQQTLLACALGGHFLSWRQPRSETLLGARTGKSVFPARSLQGTLAVSLCAERTSCPLIVIERENKTAKRISA
jgi:hypothetical protein